MEDNYGKKRWVYDPHSGGVKIPKAVQERTRYRIIAYAEKNFSGKFARIDVRFRGALCYVDAYTEPFPAEGTARASRFWKVSFNCEFIHFWK